MSDLPSFLRVKYWYQCFVVLGILGIVASLSVKIDTITNSDALLFLGLFFFGTGEWINHPVQSAFVPPNAYTGGPGIITRHNRQPSFRGYLFDILGFLLILAAAYKLFYAP
jgi:hypothetical protein